VASRHYDINSFGYLMGRCQDVIYQPCLSACQHHVLRLLCKMSLSSIGRSAPLESCMGTTLEAFVALSNEHFKPSIHTSFQLVSRSAVLSGVQGRHSHLDVSPSRYTLKLLRIILLIPTAWQRFNHRIRIRGRKEWNRISWWTDSFF
jgi:hypothetical protein